MPSIDFISVLFGLLGGIILMLILTQIGLYRGKQKAKAIVDEANQSAKNIIKQATLDGKTQAYDLKLQAEKEIKEQRNEVQNLENKLLRREDSLDFREETLK